MLGWLVSYPKSGSTWLRMMLSSLVARGGPRHINDRSECTGPTTYAELDEVLGIESSELTPIELADLYPAFHVLLGAQSNALTMRKVHDRFWCTATGKPVFPAAVSQSAIYLIRDPRDIAVSFAHHRGRDADWAIDFMADEMTVLAGDDDLMKAQLPQPLGSWSTHASSWHDQDDVPFMTVRYEDLLSEPVHHLTMIAAQLRIPIDPAAAASAVADTRFDVLQEQELADGFVERRRGSSALFFREGRAGGWQAHLTPSQAGRIVDRHREVMVRFGYV